MFTWRFWREAIERAVKSGAQAVVLAWGGGDAIWDLFAMDVQIGLGAAGGGALLSILTSLINVKVGAENSPSAIAP